jgi:hypothetical protein
MQWYNYEQRHPRAFAEFCDWYKSNYPLEYKECHHPVYKEERLLEYFKEMGLPVEVEREGLGQWHVKVGSNRQNVTSEREALRNGIYTAFMMREQTPN